MARHREEATYQTGLLLLLLLCATCLFAGPSAAVDGDPGLRGFGIVHVANDTVKSFTGPLQRVTEHAGAAYADVPATLASSAFLLAGVALATIAAGRRRLLLATVSSRAPPGGSAPA